MYLLKLKGVGPYTSAAISSICFNEKRAVVDGNVYRVLSRVFNIKTAINSHLGIKPSLNLVRVEEGNRSQNNLTAEIAEEFGVSLTELKNAQKKCNI